MANKIIVTDTNLTNIGDAIREKEGSSATIPLTEMPTRIRAIETAKPEETKTVTPTTSTQYVYPSSGYTLSQVTVNPIPSNYIVPSGNVNITSTGAIDVTKYATAKIVDSDLVASNIKKGVSIFGVTGTYEGLTASVSGTVLTLTNVSVTNNTLSL